MTRRVLYLVFLLLLLADIGYSFVQHVYQPLDGDMSICLVPGDDIQNVFDSPLGFDAIFNHKKYPNTNRFFCHWAYKEFLIKVPLVLQNFDDPLNSVYLTCAIAKIIIQVILIFLLAMAISGTWNVRKFEFILAAFLITPLFQTNGYREYIGIIDPSTTYTFFYALPCIALIIYFLPLFFRLYHKRELRLGLWVKIIWIFLALVVCLSGPLNPGVIVILAMLLMGRSLVVNYTRSPQKGFFKKAVDSIAKVPSTYWFYFIPAGLFSLYSLFLGSYNISAVHIPIAELYPKMLKGVYHQFAHELGGGVLFLMLLINTLIIYKTQKDSEGKKILNVFLWIAIFSVCYLLLLPFGGYRSYRPYVIRYDTVMPITLCLIFALGLSTLFIIKNASARQKLFYLPLIGCFLALFTYADQIKTEKYNCERMALNKIATSPDAIVEVPKGCTVLAWYDIDKPEESDLHARLLVIWGITKEKKLYYNK